MTHRYFVTGTDTDIGKTVVSAFLVHKLNSLYWKPIQSGILYDDDTKEVKKICNLAPNRYLKQSYLLKEPLSPHLAARLENVTIDTKSIHIPKEYANQDIIIEGAGGIFVPLNDNTMIIDLIKQLDLETIIVARSGLGTINHTLLTLAALRSYNIKIKGVILKGDYNPENKKDIETYGNIKILAQIPHLEEITTTEFDKIPLNI